MLIEYSNILIVENQFFTMTKNFLKENRSLNYKIFSLENTVSLSQLALSLERKEKKQNIKHNIIHLYSEDFLIENDGDICQQIDKNSYLQSKIVVLSNKNITDRKFGYIPADIIQAVIPNIEIKENQKVLSEVIHTTFKIIELSNKNIELKNRLALSYKDIQHLTKVGQELSTEKNFDILIGSILKHSIKLSSSDGGSIYITEKDKKNIRFKKSAMNLNANEFVIPIDKNSIAGYVALTGESLIIDDVYALDGSQEYHFNFDFDKSHDYHTKSMMVIPMKNHKNEVIGVLQLINRKIKRSKVLTVEELKGADVISYSKKDYELMTSLAGQAAVSVENNLLINDIKVLFEGFIKASVTAIEQRDPTTSGHSQRVADLTVNLAMTIHRATTGRFADFKFSEDQIREIRYASLLHDFGKIGVRENVLVKAKKLYDEDLNEILWKIKYSYEQVKNKYNQKKIDFYKSHTSAEYLDYEKIINIKLAEELTQLKQYEKIILQANEPSIMEDDEFVTKLKHISDFEILVDNKKIKLLSKDNFLSLSIKKGTLTEEERIMIESHVTHTYSFLQKIPWTSDLQCIPNIAHGHHEKLNGSGYPLGIKADEIPIQAKMMAISDIFDALTALDRPYKKAIETKRALQILQYDADDNKIDNDLLKIFIEAEVFKCIMK